MNKNVILKSIIRKPIVAILLILLIGLVSYGFVGKAVETIIVWRETDRLEGYYRSIGSLEKTDYENEQNPFLAGANVIRQSPDLEFDDLRKQTAGFMRDFYNTDYGTGTMDVAKTLYSEASFWYGEGVNNLDYWFYGKLIYFSKEYEQDPKLKNLEFFTGYNLVFQVDEVLAGYPERIEENQNYVIWIPARYTENIDDMSPYLETMKEGESYLIRAWSHPSLNFSVVGLPVNTVNAYETMNLKPLDGKDLWYIAVEDNQRLDLELPEYEEIRLEIDRLNENLRAILLIGTSDMSAMPEMQVGAKYNYLVDGRWLNRDDDLTSRNVIVISKNLAEIRGLSIGDELTLTMRALMDPYFCYIRSAEDIANWRNYQSQEVTFEVVGVYSNSWMDSTQSFDNTFTQSYVPLSTITDEFAFSTYWSKLQDPTPAYSFVLKDPRMQDDFIEEYETKLQDLGFALKFSDNDAKNFVAGVDPLRKSNLIGAIVYTIALLVAVALSVFLYLQQQRRNFAILRALGVPAEVSKRQLVQPLLILGSVGSTLGAILSWENAHAKAGESLSKLPLPSGVFPELDLNPWIGIGFWLLVLLILFVGVQVGNKRMSRTPVLALLQDNKSTKEKLTSNNEQKQKAEEILPLDKNLLPKSSSEQVGGSASADPRKGIRNFSRLNLIRSPLKNLLTIAVAVAMILSLGWFQSLIKANEQEVSRLYESTKVQIDIKSKSGESFNTIPRRIVEQIQDTPFILESYLSVLVRFRTEFDKEKLSFDGFPPYSILAVNSIENGLKNRLSGYKIAWMPGYSPEEFSEIWSANDINTKNIPVIVPDEILQEQDWDLGDLFTTELENVPGEVTFQIVGSSTGGTAGIKTTFMSSVGSMIEFDYRHMITNLSAIDQTYSGYPGYTEAILFSEPSMNYRLNDLKTIVKDLLGASKNTTINVTFWDEELLAVVEPLARNLSLMERLYPVTMLIAAVIGGVLCMLLVLNQAKETALLRMLGVGKSTIRSMQVKQIFFLTLIGLLLGFILLIVLRGLGAAQPSVAFAALVYLVGALLGTLLGTIQVSKKKPMELLQVKE